MRRWFLSGLHLWKEGHPNQGLPQSSRRCSTDHSCQSATRHWTQDTLIILTDISWKGSLWPLRAIRLCPRSQNGQCDATICSCQELFNCIQHPQQARCNTLLVEIPKKKAHRPMAVSKLPGMMAANAPWSRCWPVSFVQWQATGLSRWDSEHWIGRCMAASSSIVSFEPHCCTIHTKAQASGWRAIIEDMPQVPLTL